MSIICTTEDSKKNTIEYYLADNSLDREIINLFIEYYTNNGHVLKRVFYFTNKLSSSRGINKVIEYYDDAGFIREREFYPNDTFVSKNILKCTNNLQRGEDSYFFFNRSKQEKWLKDAFENHKTCKSNLPKL